MIDPEKLKVLTQGAMQHMLRDGVRIDEHDTVRDIFDKWLRYEGIIGYTDEIIYMLDSLRAAGSGRG